MNDEQLDKILKKALTPQREIKEEEIVLKKRRKEEKMMRKKRMKMAGIAGTVAAALALACIVPQTSFAEQLKKMFQGYWGQRSELSDYVTRGVFSDQDEHMIFSVEEILSDEVVVSAVVRYEAKDETGEKWLATKGPAGSESYDENGNLIKIGVSSVSSLYKEFKAMVNESEIAIDRALSYFTSNVAKALEIYPKKGCIAEGSDADMIIFNNDFCIDHVIANGRVMVEDGKVLVYGSYE